MRPYSMDLRKRVVAACDRGGKTREQIAEEFGVSTAWIRRMLQRRRETGSIAPLPQNPGRHPKLSGQRKQRLRGLVERYPDATLEELRRKLGVRVALSTLHRALVELKLTLKKNPS